MKRLLPLAFLLGLSLIPMAARADVVPGDEVCKPWEHWEGAHDGECRFGCSVSGAGRGSASAPLALIGALAGLWLVARRRRQGSTQR